MKGDLKSYKETGIYIETRPHFTDAEIERGRLSDIGLEGGHELYEPVTDLCAIATPYGVISIQKWRDYYRMRLNENNWSEWSLQKP